MRIRPRLARPFLLVALASTTLLAACEGMNNPLGPNPANMMPDDSDFVRSQPMPVPEFDFLWERAKFMLQTDGYGMDGSRSNRAEKELVSQWKTILSPSRYKGKRRRVVMRFEDVGEGRWIVATAVIVQRNEDIQNPMEIARAVWKEQPADTSRAEVFVYKLETGFQDDGEGAGAR